MNKPNQTIGFTEIDLLRIEALCKYKRFQQKKAIEDRKKVSATPVQTSALKEQLFEIEKQLSSETLLEEIESEIQRRREVNTEKVNEHSDTKSAENIGEKYYYFTKIHYSPSEKDKLREFGERYNIITNSGLMLRVFEDIKDYTRSSRVKVLLTGETGTGKELVARAIHRCSELGINDEKNKKFYPVNVGALDEKTMRSELFGYEKGSFTGAEKDKVGIFEEADQGTVFLDEIGEVPLNLQKKLLRPLAENEVRRVGANKAKQINVNIVSATNRNLESAKEKKIFRKDLYYRLTESEIHIPPLRNRKEDIPPIAMYHLRTLAIKENITLPETFNEDLFSPLKLFDFPGNVRELENFIKNLLKHNRDYIDKLKPWMVSLLFRNSKLRIRDIVEHNALTDELFGSIEYMEIFMTYVQHNFNQSATGKYIGRDKSTMRYKINTCVLQLGNEIGFNAELITKVLIDYGLIGENQSETCCKTIKKRLATLSDANLESKHNYCDSEYEHLLEEYIESCNS